MGEDSGSILQLRTIVRAAALDENAATRISDGNVHGVVRIADGLFWLTCYERDSIVVAAGPSLYLSVVAGTLARAGLA